MREINQRNGESGKQIAVFYPWGNKWPSVSAITKPDPNSEFLNQLALDINHFGGINLTD